MTTAPTETVDYNTLALVL